MKRHESREAAFLLIFESIMTGESAEETLQTAKECEELGCGLFELDARSEMLFRNVYEKREELDACIRQHLTGWTVARISKVALAALRLALYEMDYCDDVDADVAISEAVKLTEAYAMKEEVGFVNGVLASAAKARKQ